MRKIAPAVMGIIVVASCIPWLRHQHFFSMGVGVTAIVLAGLLVASAVHAVSTWSQRQEASSQPARRLSPRLRNWLLLVVLLGLLIPVVSQFMARSSDAYKLAVATARQTPQFTEALGAPIREAWFSEGTTEYGNPTKAELTIPVKGSRDKGDLRALAVKEGGRWKLKELTLELAQSGERIDLLTNSR